MDRRPWTDFKGIHGVLSKVVPGELAWTNAEALSGRRGGGDGIVHIRMRFANIIGYQ
jgi:hypothetical protein